MSTTAAEYVKRAEECERLAGACIAESNREILLFAADKWRRMAKDAAARSGGPAPPESDEPLDAERDAADE
jgi:hypothetical protein